MGECIISSDITIGITDYHQVSIDLNKWYNCFGVNSANVSRFLLPSKHQASLRNSTNLNGWSQAEYVHYTKPRA